MLVDLKDLFAGGAPIQIDYPLDLSGYEVPQGGFPFSEPVQVSGSIENHAGVVLLKAQAETVRHAACARCLKPVAMPMCVPFENVLVPQAPEGEAESDDILVCPEQTVDLDVLVKTNLVLALPMRELCKPDCKGLCPQCGKDLNEGPCGCKPEGHPAFQVLRDLLK